jgi:high-affinity Fe2+/Pb2+ permease
MQLVMKPEQDSKKTEAKSARRGLYVAASGGTRAARVPKDDGTRQLLQSGGGTIVAGLVALLLMVTVFGGVTRQGPHTSSGWLALIVALMCLPFGSLLFLLGAAKWLRKRRLKGHD